MSTRLQAVFGLLMMAVGGVKTWLHMGSVPGLSIPMCSGETVTIGLNNGSWLTQAHCWGCYMCAAGLALAGIALYRGLQKRRSVTTWMD